MGCFRLSSRSQQQEKLRQGWAAVGGWGEVENQGSHVGLEGHIMTLDWARHT